MIGKTATLVFAASAALGTTSLAVLNVVFVPQIYPMDPVATALSENVVPAEIVAPPENVVPAEPARLAALGDTVDEDTVDEDTVDGSSTDTGSVEVGGTDTVGTDTASADTASADTASADTASANTRYVVNFPRARRRPQRATAMLRTALASYRARAGSTMVIVGHADARGTDVSNLDLSRERAEFVAGWMREQGVSDSAISIAYHGEERPIDHRRGARADARNRRVEIEIRRRRQ